MSLSKMRMKIQSQSATTMTTCQLLTQFFALYFT